MRNNSKSQNLHLDCHLWLYDALLFNVSCDYFRFLCLHTLMPERISNFFFVFDFIVTQARGERAMWMFGNPFRSLDIRKNAKNNFFCFVCFEKCWGEAFNDRPEATGSTCQQSFMSFFELIQEDTRDDTRHKKREKTCKQWNEATETS